ncbi:MAG: HAMP domain-containing histidine kinase [Acidobacteria bacterium]|nr:HAMP domain-containing histidine kinase [Acidobacteriota bacterium]MBV9623313.1 HAMP domain-containing histidine kinase [Acidobacteriota bacterium]
MLTLELAVILPAAVLVILSARHLKSIQRDRAVEAAIERDFSQVLAISEKQINHKAYELADEVRSEFPGPGAACTVTLDRILAAHPYVAHLMIYDPQNGFVFRSQPYKLNDPGFRQEHEYISKMMEGWWNLEFDEFSKKLAKMQEKGTPFLFENDWSPRGEKHVYSTTAIFLKTDEESGHPAIAGITFDADYLREQFFPQTLDEIMSRNVAEAQTDKNAVIMVRPKSDSTPLAYCKGWDGGEAEVERNMEGAFPGLVLGMKLRGTTLAALGQHFMHTSFLTLGALSLLLAGGIVVTYRNVSKEMALARLKSDFVSNVSHELRTPLALIRLYAETLELGRLTSHEKQQEYYCIIRKESERLSALINNILDFSRIEAGRKEYDFRETDMRELVRNTLESYRYQIEQNGFTFEEQIADVPPLRVDREAIARSLVNLVNNALKYSQDRKYIGVNLFRDNGCIKLEVIDRGIGIAAGEQHKIFEKFYRVGDPLVHNTKGSGLGLSLVQHIARAHGGQVAVDSTPGAGSKFTIILPLYPLEGGKLAASV